MDLSAMMRGIQQDARELAREVTFEAGAKRFTGGIGSGVILSADGLVLTNAHVASPRAVRVLHQQDDVGFSDRFVGVIARHKKAGRRLFIRLQVGLFERDFVIPGPGDARQQAPARRSRRYFLVAVIFAAVRPDPRC